MFSIMTFSLLCRMFDTMNRGVDPLAFLGGSPIFALIVVGVAFIAIVAKVGERFNPTLIYRLSLPIMVAGYVAIALLFDSHAAISLLIINVGYEFFDILTWVLFVDASRRRNENALYIFGLGVAFMFCGMALGNAASHIVDALVAGGNLQANVVAMAAILCLVVVAFLVLPEGTVAQLSRREGHAERGEGRTGRSGATSEGQAEDSDNISEENGHAGATADRLEPALRRRCARFRAHTARERGHRASSLRAHACHHRPRFAYRPRVRPVPTSRTSTASWTCTSSKSSSIWSRTMGRPTKPRKAPLLNKTQEGRPTDAPLDLSSTKLLGAIQPEPPPWLPRRRRARPARARWRPGPPGASAGAAFPAR